MYIIDEFVKQCLILCSCSWYCLFSGVFSYTTILLKVQKKIVYKRNQHQLFAHILLQLFLGSTPSFCPHITTSFPGLFSLVDIKSEKHWKQVVLITRFAWICRHICWHHFSMLTLFNHASLCTNLKIAQGFLCISHGYNMWINLYKTVVAQIL